MSLEVVNSNTRGAIETGSFSKPQRRNSEQSSAQPSNSEKTANERAGPADKTLNEPPTLELLNKFIADAKAEDLEFSVDPESGLHIVKLVDKRTNEIIRQFPEEELLKIKNTIRSDLQNDENLRGILIETEV